MPLKDSERTAPRWPRSGVYRARGCSRPRCTLYRAVAPTRGDEAAGGDREAHEPARIGAVHTSQSRRPLQDPEQAPACLQRVVERVRLDAQQHREVETAVEHAERLRPQVARGRQLLLLPRGVALPHRDHRGDARRHRKRREPGDRGRSQATSLTV